MRPPIIRLSLVAGIVLACAAGCSTPPQEPDKLGAYDQPKQIMVAKNRSNYVAYVDAGTGDMSTVERQRMITSLSTYGALNSLTVSIRGDQSAAQMQRVSQALIASGISRERISIVSGGVVYPGLPGAPPASPDPQLKTVTLSVEYLSSVVPGCPDWRRANILEGGNGFSSNFGCSNLSNFGQMLVNPGDLERGVPSGYADGARSADAVRAYEEGKVKLPPAQSQPYSMPSGAQ